MSTLITRIANASARVASKMTNELVFGTTSRTATSATITIPIFAAWLDIARPLLSPEQTGRLDRQDQRHRRIQREVGDFREQRLAEVVGEADQQRADGRAAEAAHAADDDDGEGERQHFEIQPGI